MNTTITIRQNAHDAIIWCSKTFGANEFKLASDFPGNTWRFTFFDSTQAMHFALKWGGV
jgi:hypothetical protein